MAKITKAVIPAAGLGTRFLPATKALPKEMLPIVDTPAIQFVVEEAVDAGLSSILMITGRNKNALENHFDRAIELESLLIDKGDVTRLEIVEKTSQLADIHYVRQGNPKGLGHAVSKARPFVGNEAFAVLLGDDIIHEEDRLLKRMTELSESTGASVVAFMEIPLEEVSKYGVAIPGELLSDGIFKLEGLVEKPKATEAPSQLVSIGRYVLQPGVFDIIEGLEKGVGGEIQLTDAIDAMAKKPNLAGPVIGIRFDGRRFDTGDKLSYLKATVELAIERDDIGKDFSRWLADFVSVLNKSSES